MVQSLVNDLLRKSIRRRENGEADSDSAMNLGAAADVASDGVDPLDAYMATVEAELLQPASDALESGRSSDRPLSPLRPRSRSRSPAHVPAPLTTEERSAPADIPIPSAGSQGSQCLPPPLPPAVAARNLAAAAAAAAMPGSSCSSSVPGHVWAPKNQVPIDCSVLHLATGKAVNLAAEAERREKAPEPGLQDRLLGELESDGSEMEQEEEDDSLPK